MTKFYVREDGSYIGGFESYTPTTITLDPVTGGLVTVIGDAIDVVPEGGIEVTAPPLDSRDAWNPKSETYDLHEDGETPDADKKLDNLVTLFVSKGTLTQQEAVAVVSVGK